MGLKVVLARNRLSQRMVSEALGVSDETVSRWTNGRNDPRGRNLVKLMDFLRVYEPTIQLGDVLGDGAAA